MTGIGVRETEHVRFPPKWRHVLVPTAPRSAAAVGITLYTACQPVPLLAQRLLWAGTRLAGARALPGPRERWRPPVPEEVLAVLWPDLAARTGARAYAVYERLQTSRAALTLLACAGRRSVLVRVRPDAASLAKERAVSAAAQARPPRTFRVPGLVADGVIDGWHWVAYETIATRPHAPVRRAPDGLFEEARDLVERALERPPGLPDHWRGAHGDLTPWNLRRTDLGTWLIDWEDAGWAPPGADRVYSAVVSAGLKRAPRRPAVVDQFPEAAAYWREIVTARTAEGDADLHRRLLGLLR